MRNEKGELVVGDTLSLEEFKAIVQEINESHRFGFGGQHVKYIAPQIDTRDWKIYAVEFRGLGSDQNFDFRDSTEPMADRIRGWLAERKSE